MLVLKIIVLRKYCVQDAKHISNMYLIERVMRSVILFFMEKNVLALM